MNLPLMPDATRLPLNTRRGISTFGMSVLGLLTANLLPFMVIALQDSLGVSVAEAGTIMTGSLLATALACIAVTRLAEGSRRIAVARVGLVVTALGFGVAAFPLGTTVTVVGVIVGGAGAGGALAASGAALAALRNPNRMSAANGLVNRAVVTLVLAVIPLVGVGLGSVYGFVAGLAIVLLVTSGWLPAAPVLDSPDPVRRTLDPLASVDQRRITVAGVSLLVMYAVWAISEDSLWAIAGTMGADNAQLSDAALGVVLSASSAGGFFAALVLILLGDRVGRALPMAVLLVVGGALKLGTSLATDPTVYGVLLVAWNSVYLAAFLFFIATAAALDANGRFSGPSLGVYLVGTSFAPAFGGWLVESFGYSTFGWVVGVTSWLLVVPVVLVARLSTRVEQAENQARQSDSLPQETSR
ncbi:MFS transporter [Rhodococcus sp. IEGM 1354]|uniref:MFS transporter n=1 Tax=Rhodococcus sp. IEGM 1354 TaxID=3047088 RepID=UPI0024B7B508|nr:MFS transporter [Rhodococcus sp. IEGM 1354]MDI9930217.1 MFS transporter [Rhodococcus sp. IEGM 1354]